MSRIRFEIDRRQFGKVTFMAPALRQGARPQRLEAVMHAALTTVLGVQVRQKREGLFGPRIRYFSFRGETITLRSTPDGTAQIDLSTVDDETREVLIEALRHSFEFESL